MTYVVTILAMLLSALIGDGGRSLSENVNQVGLHSMAVLPTATGSVAQKLYACYEQNKNDFVVEISRRAVEINRQLGVTVNKSASKKSASANNKSLSNAKQAKQDEFYTQLSDISNELKHYKEQLRGKIVLCNCDDPFESNFFKYFALNFNELGLKKLIATSYAKSSVAGSYLPLLDIEIGRAHV